MKKIILGTSLVLALLAGCGSDKKSKVSFNDIKIDYKTKGAYNLSEYIIPKQNQISNYVENEYTNNNGKRDYSKKADEGSPFYTSSRFDVNNTTVKEFSDETLDTTYSISTDRITSIDADDGSKETFVLFADKGDYVMKEKVDDEDLGSVEVVCKLTNHYESKKVSSKTYDDVIEVVCDIDSYDSGKVGGSNIEVIGNGTNTKLFAKNKGLISDIYDFCRQTKSNGKKTEDICVKTTKEITTIN